VTIEFRTLTTAAELADLPAFEQRVWGMGDGVSLHMLVATVAEGGMAIGAYDDGRLVGSVYGFRTFEAGVLHSHYMAVDPAHRRGGLGSQLKRRQREWCLERGIKAMRWTFDPLQLNNAHLNLHTLGAVGVAYHEDHYGVLGGINGNLPSDRLTVQWDLVGPPFSGHQAAAVEVPAVSTEEIAASAEAAIIARLAVRRQMKPLLSQGWRVTAIDRDSRVYTLSK